MRVIGIDEAGRGPVLGSLWMAGVVIDKKQQGTLTRWGVKDSKLLSVKKREELFDKIIDKFEHHIVAVSPREIDQALSKDSALNLNWLEAITQALLINKFDVSRAIVDCPSRNVPAFTAYLKGKLDNDVELICEHKADMNHVVVGAASILAKVSRDREMKRLQEEVGFDCGSGYLTDPKTAAFVTQYWDKYPQVFRTKWATYQELMKKKSQSTLDSF